VPHQREVAPDDVVTAASSRRGRDRTPQLGRVAGQSAGRRPVSSTEPSSRSRNRTNAIDLLSIVPMRIFFWRVEQRPFRTSRFGSWAARPSARGRDPWPEEALTLSGSDHDQAVHALQRERVRLRQLDPSDRSQSLESSSA
jgi:hypothetical protein